MENKRETFEQAQEAWNSYNMLLGKLIHVIINIGSSNDMPK